MSASPVSCDRDVHEPGSRSPAEAAAGLVAWLLTCFAASGVGTVAVSRTLDTWYNGLVKPPWNPPNWVFAPVWTTLYTAMAISAWLVWRRRHDQPRRVRVALAWFVIQLVLNAAWSWLFFAWRLPGWAFAEIVFLWIAIVVTIRRDWPISRPAAWLLVPYLGWVTFASSLNMAIWRLNP